MTIRRGNTFEAEQEDTSGDFNPGSFLWRSPGGLLYKSEVRHGVLETTMGGHRWGPVGGVAKIAFDAVIDSVLRYCPTVMDSCLPGHPFPKVDFRTTGIDAGRVSSRFVSLQEPQPFRIYSPSAWRRASQSMRPSVPARCRLVYSIDSRKIGTACDPSSPSFLRGLNFLPALVTVCGVARSPCLYRPGSCWPLFSHDCGIARCSPSRNT